MKKFTLLFISIFLLSTFFLAGIDKKVKNENYGFFAIKVKGSGVISDPLNGKNLIKENMPLQEKDIIYAKRGSYFEFLDSSGNILRIGGESSKVKVEKLEDGKVILKLIKGNIFINKNTNDPFIIKSDDAYIVSNGGSRFLIDKVKNDVNVYCFVGPLLIGARKNKRSLYEPKSASIHDGRINILKSDEYKSNDLYRWSDFRDREINNKISKKFLAFRDIDPVILYELSHYGNWVKHPKWGYVWVPNKIPSDWHPYAYGRWYSVGRDTNLTWISAEPWGFVYYCGNWAFDSKYGWVLIPSRMNRPIFSPVEDVCWYMQGDYIYWVWKGFFNKYTYNEIPKKFFSGVSVNDFLDGKFATKRRVKNSIKRLTTVRLNKYNLIKNGGELFRRISQSNFYRRYYGGNFVGTRRGSYSGSINVGGGFRRGGVVFRSSSGRGVTAPKKPKRK